MIYLRRILAAALLGSVAALLPLQLAAAKAPVWETVRTGSYGQAAQTLPGDRQASFEAIVRDGAVYISTDAAVKVEVYTILGQLVTSHTLQPGLTRLTLGQRGVYIIKGAGVTRRVNI
ncbi:MAG: T9SS type A sorting domain-containing protein [Muribaculaceae bacterium]|nr:T9SS type A sorting domain-containing protein [Muribaculaceae bacterium]MDE6197981.1 T9SS type A sorting domain-containing protein [Muribaculaceae bacterium]